MKNTAIALSIIFCLFFSTNCSNKSSPLDKTKNNATDGKQAAKVDAIDTPDCKMLFYMIGATGTIVTKENLLVKNTLKPVLKINFHKETFDKDYQDNLTVDLTIDSIVRVDKEAQVTFTFADKTTIAYKNIDDNNFEGNYIIWFAPVYTSEKSTADPNLEKLQHTKISSIQFETRYGNRDYVLNDIESTNLLYLINCIHKAK